MVSSLVSFMPRPCLPNRTLCTPDEPVVELRAGGYHVIVPANLEWGASIENPAGKHIRIENVTGTVCWDPAAGVSACAGPEGGNQPRRQDLLDPQAAAGSLVTKTEAGRTYFSINDRAGEAFRDNEGYFEFDVRIE